VALSLCRQAHAASCEVSLNVTDKDPAGLNVRATPGGAIIGTLKGGGELVSVTVTGQSGAWARIDGAYLTPKNGGDLRTLFSGVGYVAFSQLGKDLDPEVNGEILAEPRDDAHVVLKLPGGDAAMPKAEVIGCSRYFIEVRVRGLVGWTNTGP